MKKRAKRLALPKDSAVLAALLKVVTFGDLNDQLSIANVRLWHLEERRRDMKLSDQERLAAADAIAAVNKERNNLIDAANELLSHVVATGQVPTKPKTKLY